MPLFIRSEKPLSQLDIFYQLKELRHYSAASYSNYWVSAIVEVKLSKNSYFYTLGVNVEIDGHNRLSIHGEQNALVNAVTLLGNHTKFSKLWIMAAPADAIPSEVQKAGKPCGHCRQIMMSLAEPGAKIYVVTLDGRFAPPDSFEGEKSFLPDGFSERDLNFSSTNFSYFSPALSSNSDFPKCQAYEIISESRHLTPDKIAKYFRVVLPHIIDKHFQTSPITACIVKCNNKVRYGYALGVLVQDIAFLTTDAIFSTIGNAITQFGNKNLIFDEIHIASTELHAGQLTFTEIEALRRYVHDHTFVHFYTLNHKPVTYTFLACKRARYEMIQT